MTVQEKFQAARKPNSDFCVLEGIHPLKHALRFDAKIVKTVTNSKKLLLKHVTKNLPELKDHIQDHTEEVSQTVFEQLAPQTPNDGVIAIARKGKNNLDSTKTSILLEDPKNLGNVGAVIRLAAARGVATVMTTGDVDPWHPLAIRGSRGLHFAVNVVKVKLDDLADDIPIIGFDADGDPLQAKSVKEGSVIAFGSELQGLSKQLKSRLTKTVSIPMQPKVSSLNLATSVAIAIYSL